jgi:hypothetical protein
LAISAFYCPDGETRQRGFDACNALALSRRAPNKVRNLACYNTIYYVGLAAELFPSIRMTRQAFTGPEGYLPLSPSIAVLNGTMLLIIRIMNYRLENGR